MKYSFFLSFKRHFISAAYKKVRLEIKMFLFVFQFNEYR
ncbi:hypothetical protein NT05HA_0225 [Aggregatibacter aphrophilus NJ8700]|nr:hypothetical protein NT05HA_0225 [Aggregatibacter aphrophilus NJ8700]